MRQYVGTVPDILGLVWPSFRSKSGSKSKISGRILKSFRGLFSSAEYRRNLNDEQTLLIFDGFWVEPPYVLSITKPYKFIGFGAMDVTKPRNCTGFGAMTVTKPFEGSNLTPLEP